MAVTSEIHDEEGRSLLDTIDEIRQLAKIPQQIELPQIIVVGQQSSGKSSVLRAVSGIPFPTESGLCTQFAIEICCRRSDETYVAARIAPSGEVDEDKSRRLNNFARRWENAAIDTEGRVRDVIEQARIAMGLQADTGYSYDTLLIEIQGPSQEHLTIIDLPGLISSGEEAEIDQVDRLVDRYLGGRHTIILAVIHGFSDGSNQRIFNLESEYWRRAVGVITAADMVDWTGNGAKGIKYLVSASSKYRPRYGWHIVRNLSSVETRKGLDRDQVETKFFSDMIGTTEWKGMERVLHGIEPLRQKLSKTLKELIASFLPEMLNQIDSGLGASRIKLRALGNERATVNQQRRYLGEVASTLKDKIRSSLEGRADALEIALDAVSLRDKVRNMNEEFAEEMFDNGHTWEIESESMIAHYKKRDANYQDDPQLPLKIEAMESSDPYSVSKQALLDYFTSVISRRRGRALQGTFDPIWAGTFFMQQSRKWKHLVEMHSEKVYSLVLNEIQLIVSECAGDATATSLWTQIFEPELRQRHVNLEDKMEEILTPYKTPYPATLNRNHSRALLERGTETQERSSELLVCNEIDLQLQAGAHIHRCMDSYYHVAINVLLDNIQSLAVENVLLKGLENIFLPESLNEMNDEKIYELAAESLEIVDERRELVAIISDFEQAKRIIQRQRSRSFAAVVNSPVAASQRGPVSVQPIPLPITRSMSPRNGGSGAADGDTLHYPSIPDRSTNAMGQKSKSKGKQTSTNALSNGNQTLGHSDDATDSSDAEAS